MGQGVEEVVEEGDGFHYTVPRVRVMFAAEDPEVFGRRIAYAYRARQVIHVTCIGLFHLMTAQGRLAQ